LKRRLAIVGLAILLLAAAADDALGGDERATGPRIAFLEWKFPLQLRLGTVGANGSEPRTVRGSGSVTPTPVSGGAWSPDGRLIYYSAYGGSILSAEPKKGGGEEGIYVVAADGGRPRLVPGTARGSNPVVSSDGRWVAFTRYRFKPPERETSGGTGVTTATPATSSAVWIAPLQGDGKPRRLTPLRRGMFMTPTSFSLEAPVLAITRSTGRESAVVTLDLENGEIRTIAKQAGEAAFSHDGSRIAFTSFRDHVAAETGWGKEESNELYAMNADGTEPVRLTHNRAQEEAPSWDVSGLRIAFTRTALTGPLSFLAADLVTINYDGTCATRVFHGARGRHSKRPARFALAWQPGNVGRRAPLLSC
jgi:Tol biopolymer transport system component